MDDFFRFIRPQFVTLMGFKQRAGAGAGDGIQLRQKVKTIVADRQAAIATHQMQSGVAVATTDLDQVTDIWIEVVQRREEKKKSIRATSTQAEEERVKAEVIRENLVKSLSQKYTFEEVENAGIDFTTDSKREQRRKTGAARARGKEKEKDESEGELIGMIRDMVTLVKLITTSMSASATAAIPPPPTSTPATTPDD